MKTELQTVANPRNMDLKDLAESLSRFERELIDEPHGDVHSDAPGLQVGVRKLKARLADVVINAAISRMFTAEELAQVDRDIREALATGLPLCSLCGVVAVSRRRFEGENLSLCEMCDEALAAVA